MPNPDYNIAPGMYIDWDNTTPCNLVMIDWKCDTDPCHTYWATHQFASSGVVDGYAGFQSLPHDSQSAEPYVHRLIFSLWELNGLIPEIEYVSPYVDLNNLLFEGEGLGKHVFTDFNWVTSTWYTMCLAVQNKCGKTFYSQWVKKTADSDWILCCVLSFPQANKHFPATGLFMENMGLLNDARKCSVKRAYGRALDNVTWVSRNTYTIKNNYTYKDSSGQVQHALNINQNCQYGEGTSPTCVWIEAGGHEYNSLPSPTPNYLQQYTLSEGPAPSNIPSFAPLIPAFIRSTHSNLYIVPNTSDQIVTSSNVYFWVFKESSDGYLYILTSDGTKAITMNTDYATLSMTTFSATNDRQKWVKHSYPQSTNVYFTPKGYSDRCWDLTNASYLEGAVIKLWCYGDNLNLPQFKYYAQNVATFRTIKNVNSSFYANPNPSGSSVVQNSNAYEWVFIRAAAVDSTTFDNDYYYILTSDCTKAIQAGSTSGSNLSLSSFTPGAKNQMWKLENASNGRFYIKPCNPTSMTMDVKNGSTTSGENLTIHTQSTSGNRYKWNVTIC